MQTVHAYNKRQGTHFTFCHVSYWTVETYGWSVSKIKVCGSELQVEVRSCTNCKQTALHYLRWIACHSLESLGQSWWSLNSTMPSSCQVWGVRMAYTDLGLNFVTFFGVETFVQTNVKNEETSWFVTSRACYQSNDTWNSVCFFIAALKVDLQITALMRGNIRLPGNVQLTSQLTGIFWRC